MVLPPPLQDLLPAGWLAFTGRELNPLDRCKRFQITFSFPFSGFILAQRRTYLHLSYSCASPFGPALLVTQDPSQTCGRPRLATNDPVPEEQAPLPQSALASSRRGGRSRSTH